MNKMAGAILFVAAFHALVGLGAYQYIISTDQALAVNPSESAYSSAVTVNVAASATAVDTAALDTHYCTSHFALFSGDEVFRRSSPGAVLFIR